MISQREVFNSLYLTENQHQRHLSFVVPGVVRVQTIIDFKTIEDGRVGLLDLPQRRQENTYLVIFHPVCVSNVILDALKHLMWETLGNHEEGATLVIDPNTRDYDSNTPLEILYRTEYFIGPDDFLLLSVGQKVDYD